jgi:hypothetical protein
MAQLFGRRASYIQRLPDAFVKSPVFWNEILWLRNLCNQLRELSVQ